MHGFGYLTICLSIAALYRSAISECKKDLLISNYVSRSVRQFAICMTVSAVRYQIEGALFEQDLISIPSLVAIEDGAALDLQRLAALATPPTLQLIILACSIATIYYFLYVATKRILEPDRGAASRQANSHGVRGRHGCAAGSFSRRISAQRW
jgi:hypothetical protein